MTARARPAAAGGGHTLHYLVASDEVCRGRLRRRNAGGAPEYFVSHADFELFNRHLVPPDNDERLNVMRYEVKAD